MKQAVDVNLMLILSYLESVNIKRFGANPGLKFIFLTSDVVHNYLGPCSCFPLTCLS